MFFNFYFVYLYQFYIGMKILDKVKEIVESYSLEKIKIPDGYKNIYDLLNDIPEAKPNFTSKKNDFYLIQKYKDNIGKGHYGFSIGTPTPPQWNEIIDDILQLCLEIDPKFEIHQIKIKFGILCFYCKSDVIEDLHEIESYIGRTLNDQSLKY